MKYNSIFHTVKYKQHRILFGRFITYNRRYIYITNKLHHRKSFVPILFTRCITLETHSFATLTRSFLKFCDSSIKICTAHFLWSNLFLQNSWTSKIFKNKITLLWVLTTFLLTATITFAHVWREATLQLFHSTLLHIKNTNSVSRDNQLIYIKNA